MSTVPGSLLGKNKCGQAYARLWLCVCVCFWGCVWLARVCLCVCPVSTHPSVLGGRRQKQKSEWHFRAERPWNQMQSSINSINVQRLLAIKIAQSLLVSGSKMDDQWPWRSQRSKVTVTLKCNLCWSPPHGPGHLHPPAEPGSSQPFGRLTREPCGQPLGRRGGATKLSLLPSLLSPLAEPTCFSTRRCPPDIRLLLLSR